MDFTELYKQSGASCKFSPRTGRYLSTAVQHRLVVRHADSLQICALFNCNGVIAYTEWSPCERFVLCAGWSRSTNKSEGGGSLSGGLTAEGGGWCQLFEVVDGATTPTSGLATTGKNANPWQGKIEEGAVGMVRAMWTPDGRHVLTWSEFQLRITVWSLVDKDHVRYIRFPKYSDRAFQFRADGRYLAYAERVDGRDFVSIVDARSWEVVKHFATATTDLDDLSWSPDGRYLAVWEGMMNYRVCIYSPDGRLLKQHAPVYAGTLALGVRCVAWSPSSQFLAVGSYDGKVQFLNHYTWSSLLEFNQVDLNIDVDTPVFKELTQSGESLDDLGDGVTPYIRSKVKYALVRGPLALPQSSTITAIGHLDGDKATTKIGVSALKWNPTGKLLAVKSENSRTSLVVYDIFNLRPTAVMLQLSPIRCFEWNPVHPTQLAFCCAHSGLVYLWTGDGCECVEVPAVQFDVCALRWAPDGRSLVLMDREKFAVGFPIGNSVV